MTAKSSEPSFEEAVVSLGEYRYLPEEMKEETEQECDRCFFCGSTDTKHSFLWYNFCEDVESFHSFLPPLFQIFDPFADLMAKTMYSIFRRCRIS